ncbi:MAG: hypothetical protein ABL884_09795, partial [Methyloglobulus sp.]
MTTNFTFQDWIDHLRYFMPPQGVVHVGAGAGTLAARYADWSVNAGVLIEAEETYFNKLTQVVSGLKGWSAHIAMISDNEGEAVFYKTSNPNESGSLPPEVMTKLWRNLKTIEESLLKTTTLEQLLASVGILPIHLDWLVIECLSALPILQGSGNYMDGWDVIIARVLIDENLYPGNGVTKNELDIYLGTQGYRCISIEVERQPAMASVLYIRDLKVLKGKSQENQRKIQRLIQIQDEQTTERQAQIEQLTQARDEQAKLAAERQSQIQQLEQARDGQARQAEERQAQIGQLTQARDEQAKLAVERQVQIQQLAQARDGQARQAEERQAQIEQLTQARDEQAKLAAERQSQIQQLEQARDGQARQAE